MSTPGGPTAKEVAIGRTFGSPIRPRECVDCGVPVVNRQALRCKPCRGRLQSANAGIEEDSRMLAEKIAGRTLEEIGAAHGVSKQRVSVRIKRAIDRLDESEKRYLFGDR